MKTNIQQANSKTELGIYAKVINTVIIDDTEHEKLCVSKTKGEVLESEYSDFAVTPT